MTYISLTDAEVNRVVGAIHSYIEIMGEGEDTHDYTMYELDTGLGSALKKICKGRNGEVIYSCYKSHRNNYVYPTFEEWQKIHCKEETESEEE